MADRQHAISAVMFRQPMGAGRGPASRQKAAMAVHHAFWLAGRARCVHQQSVISSAEGMQGHLRIQVKTLGQRLQAIRAGGGKLCVLICAH